MATILLAQPATNVSSINLAFPRNAFSITPSDVNDYLPSFTVYVGVSGDVSIRTMGAGASGTPVLFKNVQAGQVLPCRAVAVMASGTTASSLVGIY